MSWLFQLHSTQPVAHAIGVLAFVCLAGRALGSLWARIIDVHDQRAILWICSHVSGVPDCEDATPALPHLVGGEGALATIPLVLNAVKQGELSVVLSFCEKPSDR